MSRPSPRRAVLAWCLYDFANSSYATLIVTVVFAIYFREVVVDAQDNRGDQLLGVASALGMLGVALVSPVAGAIADDSRRRRPFLVWATIATVVATALLYTVGPGDVVAAMALYAVGTVAFELGYVFYNAFLPAVSTPGTAGRISGWGWGLGYVGGLVSLVVAFPWIASPLRDAAGSLRPEAVADRRLSFLVTAGFFLVFALPALAWLRDDAAGNNPSRPWAAQVRAGLGRLRDTLGHIREHRNVFRFLVASLLFRDGIATVIAFAGVFASTTFGFDGSELVMLFVAMNAVAFVPTVASGYLADRFGGRRTVAVSLVIWIAVILGATVVDSRAGFWFVAMLAACGMGSTQAVARSFMSRLCPADRQAEFFGFYVMSGKFAAIVGPLVFGTVSVRTGSQQLAVLSLLPLFLLGLWLTLTVDESAGDGGGLT